MSTCTTIPRQIPPRGATHAPSPDAHCGHATVAPSPPSRRRLRLTVAGRGPAPSILPFARSMLPPLRHRGCASEATPAPGARAAPRSLVAVRRWQKANVSSGCHTQWHRFMCRRPEWPAHRQAATVRTALQHNAPPARMAGSPTGCNGQNCVAAQRAAGPDGRLTDRLQRPRWRCSRKAEGTGFEPATDFSASDFESDR